MLCTPAKEAYTDESLVYVPCPPVYSACTAVDRSGETAAIPDQAGRHRIAYRGSNPVAGAYDRVTHDIAACFTAIVESVESDFDLCSDQVPNPLLL